MGKKEIMVQSATKLANKELKSNLTQMKSALDSVKKSTWKYAVALNKIITDELYKDDFKDVKEFCKFANVSGASASQYVGAVKCMDEHGWLYNDKGEVKPPYTVGNAYLLYTLKEEFDAFFEYCNSRNICTTALTQSELKKTIKEFKKGIDTDIISEETIEETTEETTEETPEETPEETTEKSGEVTLFYIVNRDGLYYYHNCIKGNEFELSEEIVNKIMKMVINDK